MTDLVGASDAGRTVLAPNGELAAALFDAVERSQIAAGRGIWRTPRVRDYPSWLREQHAERQLEDASLPRMLSDVEERELWRAVVLDSPTGADLTEPAGAARAARRARHIMSDFGIPCAALNAYTTEESLALLEWDRAFEQRCRELDCIPSHRLADSVMRVTGAAARAPGGLMWVDSPLWSPAARGALEGLGAELLAAPDARSAAVSRGLESSSPDAELAAMARWARQGLEENQRFRAWICIPDLSRRRAAVADAFDAALASQRFALTAHETLAPYAIAGGTPLADHAPVRAALDALSATSGDIAFEAWSALLRHPLLQATPADASAAALLDLQVRRRGPSSAPLMQWLRLAEALAPAPPPALVRLRTFARALDEVRGPHPLSRWVSVWVAAFEAGPWALRARWSSSEFQAAERFRDLLGELAAADASFGTLTPGAAASLLERAAHDTSFQVQTGIPPVWVSGSLLDPWLGYDGIWVSGMSTEDWPPPPDPEPLLPVRLQREHGIAAAAAETQLRAAVELQRRWHLRTGALVFSSTDSADGRPATLSPLWGTAPTTVRASAASAAVPQPHWHAAFLRAPRLEIFIDELAPAFAASERLHGIATLRAQSRCPFRGFAETRLEADVLERPMPGFNARERGEMLHDALEAVWADLASSAGLAARAQVALEELTQRAAAGAVAAQCRRRDPGGAWQRREVPRLTGLLRTWLGTERLREPFEVERLEVAATPARHGGLEFAVRVDRIDRLLAGGRVLIDYKSGGVSADWRGDRPDNPQLPIYALLYPDELVAVAYGKVNARACGFVAEAARGDLFKPRGPPTALEGLPDFPALLALWRTRVDSIAAEFAAGHAAVAPTLSACGNCNLHALCRVPASLDDLVRADE